jgi:hypothetical protein
MKTYLGFAATAVLTAGLCAAPAGADERSAKGTTMAQPPSVAGTPSP